MAKTIVHRQQNPDGTVTVWWRDDATGAQTKETYGDPVDPRAATLRRLEEQRTYYSDPWIKEHLLDPQDRMTAEYKQQKDREFGVTKFNSRTSRISAEGSIQNNRDLIEQRKAELRQNGELEVWKTLSGLRGFGNAAQFIDAGEGAPTFQGESAFMRKMTQSQGRPSTGFGQQFGMQPVSAQATFGASAPGAGGGGNGPDAPHAVNDGQGAARPGAMTTPGGDPGGAVLAASAGPAADQVAQRHAADKALARQIFSQPGKLARGSVERAGPQRMAYLGSYGEAEGFDTETFMGAYKRAGIHQGPGRRRMAA